MALVDSGSALLSRDGVFWTNILYQDLSSNVLGVIPSAIAYGNGRFVVRADVLNNNSIPPLPRIYTSTDGVSWASTNFYRSDSFVMFYGIGAFAYPAIILGGPWDPPVPAVPISTDGLNWTTNGTMTGFSGGNAGAYGNGMFVVVGNNGSLLASRDSLNWTNQLRGALDKAGKGESRSFRGRGSGRTHLVRFRAAF